MAEVKRYLAVDLGAESGRVMLGEVVDGQIDLREIHRFGNGPREVAGTLRWDFTTLLSEIKAGLAKAIKESDGPISGIGVDSWGVDYGLLDGQGQLIEDPYHYRDSRTDAMMKRAFDLMGKRAVYDHSGIQFMQINTLYQLLAAREAQSPTLAQARHVVMMADLVSYHLCGEVFAEYSLASTSQLMDMATGEWSQAIFERLGLPQGLMPGIVTPGTVVGQLSASVCRELDCDPIAVIAVGSHDTASAVAAVPVVGDSWAYLSSGTWSLMGVELDQAVINDETFGSDFTNEGGVEGTIRLLKNIMGLWLVQECRRQWASEGKELTYADMTELAEQAPPFAGWVNPLDATFLIPGEMPQRINAYLARSGQEKIKNKGQMIRLVLESLAFSYRWCLEKLEAITGKPIDVLHMVGGGIKNELLCQFGSNAIGRKVVAGPVEATALGNILIQAKACRQIETLVQGRQWIGESVVLKTYEPQETAAWNREYEKIEQVLNAG